jgi:hypothetical protein
MKRAALIWVIFGVLAVAMTAGLALSLDWLRPHVVKAEPTPAKGPKASVTAQGEPESDYFDQAHALYKALADSGVNTQVCDCLTCRHLRAWATGMPLEPGIESEKKVTAAKPQRKAPSDGITMPSSRCVDFSGMWACNKHGGPPTAFSKRPVWCDNDPLWQQIVAQHPAAYSAATNFMSPMGYARYLYWQKNGEWLER